MTDMACCAHRCAPVKFVRRTASQSSGFHAHGQAVAGDGGVVHQDVELAEFFDRLPESGLHLFGVGHVHRHGQRFAAGCGNFSNHARQFFRVARRGGHARARLRQRQRGGAPDSL